MRPRDRDRPLRWWRMRWAIDGQEWTANELPSVAPPVGQISVCVAAPATNRYRARTASMSRDQEFRPVNYPVDLLFLSFDCDWLVWFGRLDRCSVNSVAMLSPSKCTTKRFSNLQSNWAESLTRKVRGSAFAVRHARRCIYNCLSLSWQSRFKWRHTAVEVCSKAYRHTGTIYVLKDRLSTSQTTRPFNPARSGVPLETYMLLSSPTITCLRYCLYLLVLYIYCVLSYSLFVAFLITVRICSNCVPTTSAYKPLRLRVSMPLRLIVSMPVNWKLRSEKSPIDLPSSTNILL